MSDVIKIINEEISNFDFLGIEEQQEQQETIDLLTNEDFQKQFICDSLLNVGDGTGRLRDSKIKITPTDAQIGGDWEQDPDDASYITLDYFLDIEYTYDQNKPPIKFGLDFQSDRISIDKDGWYDSGRFGGTPDTDREPEGDAWLDYVDWNAINIVLHDGEGNEIKFSALEKAPETIQELFVKEYVESFIMDRTSLDIRERERISRSGIKASYC